MNPGIMNMLGLAALHLAVDKSVSPPQLCEEANLTSHRVRRWFTVLAVMRHYGLNAREIATLLQVPEKTVHRMLRGLRRLQQSDPRVAAAIRRLGSDDERAAGAA